MRKLCISVEDVILIMGTITICRLYATQCRGQPFTL